MESDPQAQAIRLLAWWDVPNNEMLDKYNDSLQIMTADWRNILQIDRHLYDGLVPWSVLQLPTAELPADDYRLALILYARESGSKVHRLDELSGEAAGIIPIAAFSIDAWTDLVC